MQKTAHILLAMMICTVATPNDTTFADDIPAQFLQIAKKYQISAFDNFARTNRPIAGDHTISGHTYWTSGRHRQFISNNYYTSTAVKAAAIAYVELEKPPVALGQWFQFHNTKLKPCRTRDADDMKWRCGENVVLGTAAKGFGLGSVQLAVWRNKWRLFYVPHPIVDPYPILAHGEFAKPLRPGRIYFMGIIWDRSKSAISVYVSNTQPTTVSAKVINRYWGKIMGIQIRRPRKALGKIGIREWIAFQTPDPG